MQAKKVNDIELLLSELDKKQLSEFIRKECAYDRQFCERFLALGIGTVFTPNPSVYQARVKDIIKKFEGRHGYVEYRQTYDLNRALVRILDEADVAMREHKWVVAMAILEGVAAAGENILECGDDSDGLLSDIVHLCFVKWHELCGEDLPAELKTKIFERSMTYFAKGHLKGWDWWWDWIQMAISLADTSEKRERVIKALDDIINTKGDDDDWSIDYNRQAAQRYKLEIMSRSGTPEEQRKFMYDNVDNPDFRKRLLQMSWDEGNYDEVFRLAKEGVKHDAEWPGLLNNWHKWELKVYRHKNDKPNILKVARYFFFNAGGFGEKEYNMENMYALMKSIVPSGEWSDYTEKLLEEALEKKDYIIIVFIYKEEKMWDRYMEYLRTSPFVYSIDTAPQEVWTLYKDELIHLYSVCVRDFFQYASNRNRYCEGVNQLRKLIKYGGKAEADEIIAEQKARRPRRPALIEELSKL